MPDRATPIITTLCGPAKNLDALAQVARVLTREGRIVIGLSEGVPQADLQQLHFRKIDMSDGIYVVNVDGYYGDGTAREIAYAVQRGKTVEWLVR
jgi:nucleoside 2-deoxyribosyltransferase